MVPFPTIIHQTWKNSEIPEKWQESSRQWKALHPTWTYHYTTDADNREYVVQHFPQYLETYDKLPYPIQRADMIRYMYLYKMGGVYSDLDIVPTRPLSDYSFDPNAEVYACTSGNTPSIFTNSFMISKANSPLWIDMLEHIKTYKKWFFTIRHVEIMNSTGPGGYTKNVRKHLTRVCTLPSKLFMRFSSAETEAVDCKQVALSEGAYNYPLVGNSWHSWDSAMLHHVSCHKDMIMWVFLFIITLVIFFFVYRSMQPMKK